MNLTKSIRELATDINAAPQQYESNDKVSEKCLSVEAEFEAAGVLRHEGEGATDGWEDAAFPLAMRGEGATDGREDTAFPLATRGRMLG